jgi:hypothetical protein
MKTNPLPPHRKYLYLKGKVIPLQAWTVPEGFRRLRLPDFVFICTSNNFQNKSVLFP